ncbi:MAG TPA: hypothetical protein V6C76_04615 [Drouetiella sp.]
MQSVECSFCEGAGSNESVLQVLNDVHICERCVGKEDAPTASATPCSVCQKCQYHVRRPKDRSDLAVCEQCIAKAFKEKMNRADAGVPHCSFCRKITTPDNLIAGAPEGGGSAHICRDCVTRFAGKGA